MIFNCFFVMFYKNGENIAMKEMSFYNISTDEFKQLQTLSSNIYNITIVVEYFCSNQQEIEELYNLTPIIKNLRNEADKLNTFFINY